MKSSVGKFKNFLRRLLEKKPYYENGLFYSEVKPFATYSPWHQDKWFNEIYKQLSSITLIDKFRLYEIYELTKQQVSRYPSASIAEIGVWRGGSALLINQVKNKMGSKGDLFLFDTFQGVAKTSDKDHYYTGGEHSDTSKDFVERLFETDSTVKIFEGIFPEESGKNIDRSIAFSMVHVDVDVYKSCKDIVSYFKDRLVSGGVIIIDDYGFSTCNGVTDFVNEIKSIGDFLVLHNLNGHALLVRI